MITIQRTNIQSNSSFFSSENHYNSHELVIAHPKDKIVRPLILTSNITTFFLLIPSGSHPVIIVMSTKDFKSTISLKFPSEHHAKLVMDVLNVDEELQPERMSRIYSVEGNTLFV